jgi:hypothetical protein
MATPVLGSSFLALPGTFFEAPSASKNSFLFFTHPRRPAREGGTTALGGAGARADSTGGATRRAAQHLEPTAATVGWGTRRREGGEAEHDGQAARARAQAQMKKTRGQGGQGNSATRGQTSILPAPTSTRQRLGARQTVALDTGGAGDPLGGERRATRQGGARHHARHAPADTPCAGQKPTTTNPRHERRGPLGRRRRQKKKSGEDAGGATLQAANTPGTAQTGNGMEAADTTSQAQATRHHHWRGSAATPQAAGALQQESSGARQRMTRRSTTRGAAWRGAARRRRWQKADGGGGKASPGDHR